MIYLSATETLICHREMNLLGSTSFGFAQNTIHDFQNTVLNSQWHCLRKMPQKRLFQKGKGLYNMMAITFRDIQQKAQTFICNLTRLE